MSSWLWVGLGATALILIGLLVFFLLRRRHASVVVAQNNATDDKAIQDATDALIQRAKAEAVSEEQMKKIDQIMQLPDPKERLKQLSDMLKAV